LRINKSDLRMAGICILYIFMCRTTFFGINPIALALVATTLTERNGRKAVTLSICAGIIFANIPVLSIDALSNIIKYMLIILCAFFVHGLAYRKKIFFTLRGNSILCAVITVVVVIFGAGAFDISNIIIALSEGVLVIVGVVLFEKGLYVIRYGKNLQPLGNEQFISFIAIIFLAINGLYEPVPDVISVRMGLMFLVMLCVAYVYGPLAGGVSGAVAGVCVSISSGNASVIGMYCIIGIITGIVRDAGKWISMIFYILSGISFALIYPDELWNIQEMKPFISAAAAFIFIPGSLLVLNDYETERTAMIRTDTENTVSMRILEFARALNKIGESMSGQFVHKNRNVGAELNRDLLANQMKELAGLLTELEKEVSETGSKRSPYEDEIAAVLEANGIIVKKIAVIEKRDGRKRVCMRVKAAGKFGITTKEAAEIISRILKDKYVADDSCGYFIPKEYSDMTFVQDVKYRVLTGVSRMCRSGEVVSGDNYSIIELPTGKVMMTIADGMGSGDLAYEESETVIEMIEELAGIGFSEGMTLRYINSTLVFSKDDDKFSTADMSVVNLNNGYCECIKCGGAVTFVKNRHGVKIINMETMPIGILPDAEPKSNTFRLYEGDMVIMISDGILDSIDVNEPEQCIRVLIEENATNNPQEMSDYILDIAKNANNGYARDDMTVLSLGLWHKI